MLQKIRHLSNEYISIRRSKIHSKGAFAKKDIPKGTYIIQYVGELITKAESNRRADSVVSKAKKDVTKGAVYIFELNKRYDIDGNVWWNPARFINHSCNPNAETVNDKGAIWIYALKDIKKGEEVTYNYGYSIDEYEDHPCRCGAKNCIGYILRKEDWPKLQRLQRKH